MSDSKSALDSFATRERLNAAVAMDGGTTNTSADVLTSLKLIGHFTKQLQDDPTFEKTEVGFLAEQELRYLKAGVRAVRDNPLLRSNFGSDFQAAQNVAAILKRKHASDVFDMNIKNFVPDRPAEEKRQMGHMFGDNVNWD